MSFLSTVMQTAPHGAVADHTIGGFAQAVANKPRIFFIAFAST